MAATRTVRRLLFAALLAAHAFLLLVLTFFLMSTDFMHGDEAWIVKNTAATIRTLLPEPNKPDQDDFAFINVSHDLQLIPRMDEFGFPAGNQVVTDRAKLAQLFSILNRDPNWKLLFVDIFFADETPADSALGAELSRLPNSLFSYHLDDTGAANKPIFEGLNLGLADYYTVDDEFLKFRLVRSEYPTVPLRMYEMIDGGKFEDGSWFWQWNDHPAFNDFVLDFRIRQFDLFKDTLAYPYANLYDLLLTAQFPDGAAQINDFTRDRIVIVGDFEKYDMHPTMYGDMAGPLILTNLYLALKNGDNRIPTGFPIYLLGLYIFLSYILFVKDGFEIMLERRIGRENQFMLLIAQGISYLLILGAASIVSFLLFNYHINFLLLAFYFNAVEWIRVWRRRRRERREAAALTEPIPEP